jgi:hypothetical protein
MVGLIDNSEGSMLEVMKFNPQLHYKTKTKIIFEYDDKRVS